MSSSVSHRERETTTNADSKTWTTHWMTHDTLTWDSAATVSYSSRATGPYNELPETGRIYTKHNSTAYSYKVALSRGGERVDKLGFSQRILLTISWLSELGKIYLITQSHGCRRRSKRVIGARSLTIRRRSLQSQPINCQTITRVGQTTSAPVTAVD